ncbi:MAG: hypothetical protein K6U89_11635 [Chloroflexi bacterium]|nr:hypothetical protein [Chloroflexota bacterium]
MSVCFFEDVAIGDELPVQEDCIGQERARRFLAVRGPQRNEGRFTNLEEARRLGLPRLLVPGPLLAAVLARTLRQWLPRGRLLKLDLVFRRNVWQEVPFTLHGVVVDTEERPEGPAVDLDLLVVDAEGERCVTGMATVILPRR